MNADYRQRLYRYYLKYAPDKSDKLDQTLAQYAGKEEQMFASLVKRYGPEPDENDPAVVAVALNDVNVQNDGVATQNSESARQFELSGRGNATLFPARSTTSLQGAPQNESTSPTAKFAAEATSTAGETKSLIADLLSKCAPHYLSVVEDLLLGFDGRADELFLALCAHFDEARQGLHFVEVTQEKAGQSVCDDGVVVVQLISAFVGEKPSASKVSVLVGRGDAVVAEINGDTRIAGDGNISWPARDNCSVLVSKGTSTISLLLRSDQRVLGDAKFPLAGASQYGTTKIPIKSAIEKDSPRHFLELRWMIVSNTSINKATSLLRRKITSRLSNMKSGSSLTEVLTNGTADLWIHRVGAFYCRYLPSQLHDVVPLRDQYRGRENELLDALTLKYGPEPSPTEFRSRVERVFFLNDQARVRESRIFDSQAAGREEAVMKALTKKYGPESPCPFVVPSTTIRAPHGLTDRHRLRLTRWFVLRFPKRVKEVDYILSRFYGREELLFRLLREFVGTEPIDSKPEESIRSKTGSSPALQKYFAGRRAPAFLQWMWSKDDNSTTETEVNGFSPPNLRIKARLERFYRKYNPAKLNDVEQTVSQWRGRYDLLFEALTQKYGPEPGTLSTNRSMQLEQHNVLSPFSGKEGLFC